MGIGNSKVVQVQPPQGNGSDRILSKYGTKSINGGIVVNGKTQRSFHSIRSGTEIRDTKFTSVNVSVVRGTTRSANNATKVAGNMNPIHEISNQRARVRKSLLENAVFEKPTTESGDESGDAQNATETNEEIEEETINDLCESTAADLNAESETESEKENQDDEERENEEKLQESELSDDDVNSVPGKNEDENIVFDGINEIININEDNEASSECRLSKVIYDGQLNVRQEDENSRCDITGCVVMDGDKLAIVDNWNSNVKLFMIKDRSFLSCIELEIKPWDITVLNSYLLVTTCNNMLAFLNVSQDSGAITLYKLVSVQGRARGITCTNNTFIVTFIHPEPCVKVIQENGNVIKVIQTDSTGLRLFKCPEYVTVDPKNAAIYVTDFQSNKVFCLTADGEIVSIYEDDDLYKPAGVVVDGNSDVLIAGWGSENIHKVTKECNKVQIVLDSRDIITYPRAMALCEYTLFMSHYHFTSINNYLSMYKIYPSMSINN